MADRVRCAHEAELREAARVLARSHRDDPAFAHVLGDRRRRVSMLAPVFGQWLRHARSAGEVDVALRGGRLVGVAAWLRPPGDVQSPDDLAAAAAPYVPLLLTRPLRGSRLLRYMAAAAASHPRTPRWYLEIIGVDDGERGRGAGRALLAAGLARVDRDGAPAYLETCERENLGLYESFGFRVQRAGVPLAPGRGAPTHWTMWREPR